MVAKIPTLTLRDICMKRTELSEFRLFEEIYDHDHEFFFRYFRMSPAQFDYILSMVSPAIIKETTGRTLQGGAKNGASLSHCKYYENSMTELRGNW